jgi:hypothetical protein
MDQKSNERPQPITARVQIDNPTPISLNGLTLLAKEANIGEATRSPTMKADDRTPSSKLLKLKSPCIPLPDEHVPLEVQEPRLPLIPLLAIAPRSI